VVESMPSSNEDLRARLAEAEKALIALRDKSDRVAAEQKRVEEDLRSSHAALEHRTGQLQALAADLTQAEQRERRRLAKVLHDHLQQLLVGAKFQTGVLQGRIRDKGLRPVVLQLTEALDEAIRSARSLTVELSPPLLYEAGLADALEWLGRQMFEKQGLDVTVRADPDTEPACEEIRVFLFDAVRELLFNVIKHADAGSAQVHLRRHTRDHIEISVSDGGVGFDPERLERHVGFGLLSIRERLELLGGWMSVESGPGRGSRITLVAPLRLVPAASTSSEVLAQAPRAAPEPAHAAVEGVLFGDGRRIRVLLADDHHVMRQGLAMLLKEHRDIEVVGQASDGQMAVDLARQLRPDVIIMDVTMPRLTGVEATEIITAEMPEVRIIGLSLHDEADMGAAMRRAGAAAYLCKGGPAEDLVSAIRDHAAAH
jgi:signal transduction histidine kinase